MKNFVGSFVFLSMMYLFSACANTQPVNVYERDALLSVHHNSETKSTLLIYSDLIGEVRHVFRRNGLLEFILHYSRSGKISIQERGQSTREITQSEAFQISKHIQILLGSQEKQETHASTFQDI